MAVKPNSYETLYLVRPDINSDELAIIQDKLTKAISSGEGEIQKNEKWADRDLAYPINDYTKGSYYILVYNSLPTVPVEIEKHLSFHKTDVLRFMTILDEEEAQENQTTATTAAETKPAEPAPAPTPEPPAETTSSTTNSDFTSPKEPEDAPSEEPAKETPGGEE